MNKNFRKYIIGMIISLTLVAGQTQSEVMSKLQQNNYSASYVIPSSSGISMAVNVWGEVRAPGQYLIPYSINLDIISLLSQAGGPTPLARLSKVILLREIDEDGGQQKIIVDLKEFTKTGDRSKLPTLQPNDTIIILPTFWNRVKSGTAWVDIIYRFATIYLLITRY